MPTVRDVSELHLVNKSTDIEKRVAETAAYSLFSINGRHWHSLSPSSTANPRSMQSAVLTVALASLLHPQSSSLFASTDWCTLTSPFDSSKHKITAWTVHHYLQLNVPVDNKYVHHIERSVYGSPRNDSGACSCIFPAVFFWVAPNVRRMQRNYSDV